MNAPENGTKPVPLSCTCFLHKLLDRTPTATSHVTHRTYTTRESLSCSNTNVIYLISCCKCKKQYIIRYTEQSLCYQIAKHITTIQITKSQEPCTPQHDHYVDPQHRMSIQSLEITTLSPTQSSNKLLL